MELLQSTTPQICIIVSETTTASPEVFGIFSGYQWESLRGKFLRAGIVPDSCRFFDLQRTPIEELWKLDCTVFIAMGEKALQVTTGKRGLDKWHLSPLDCLPEFKCRKCIPTFDPSRTQKQYEYGLYVELALQRVHHESRAPSFSRTEERFHLNPGFEQTIEVLDRIKNEPRLAVDVETGYGQINTVGFAWSESDAIAINVLPNRFIDETYFELWKKIAEVLEGPSEKIMQNFIYDTSYFSAYGIRTANITHDTMWAMKVLYPELDSNLGVVGRLYTERPYWKDDGKVESEEGKKKDWGNVRDWTKHYLYNCRDTTGTFEAALAQKKDLDARELRSFFDGYVMQLHTSILEMCSNGMPFSRDMRDKLSIEIRGKVDELSHRLNEVIGREINPNSSKQKIAYLKEQGVKIPKKYDKEKGAYRESADASSLRKVALKHPELKALPIFTEIASYNKALSSYIDFDVAPSDSRIRYMLGKFTETLRFAGGTDGWGRGFNIQTVPREGGDVSIKQMFVADEGESFVEIDLRQAESRFVAYDAACKKLIDMLESDYDVHTHVTLKILAKLGKNKDEITKEEFKKTWRQLGKKSGHGANYAMKGTTFVETCFNEMDLVLPKRDAEAILEAYHEEFPEIRQNWHAGIRRELSLKRKLSAPSGWERYFYGRFGDDMFKEAYAWRPQHTIPWITNHMMLHLRDLRKRKELPDFKLIYQGHDALVLTTRDANVDPIARVCNDVSLWHPKVELAGGRMVIPTEIQFGKTMAKLEAWHD